MKDILEILSLNRREDVDFCVYFIPKNIGLANFAYISLSTCYGGWWKNINESKRIAHGFYW